MPAVHHIRRDIRRQRKRAGNPIPVPQDRFFDIPPEYQQTTAGEAFLLHDTGYGDDRILVFATNENIQLLAESQSGFMGGTFKTFYSGGFLSGVFVLGGFVRGVFVGRYMSGGVVLGKPKSDGHVTITDQMLATVFVHFVS